ncbi:hypothetical protein [Mucilaginibacter celer]|uniref:Uncharacterized protein n=1 Tax=Mucilaginibacter celer TaxID=2305508 RepID=A0A494VRQ0_9SPHI|nr:hypothetical protein [Mucilaginibacter celer]AYL96060.1 hypothetical protein HYN43_012520 [Mucilaginibacter celer]
MKYSEWKTLDADEQKNTNWHRRPPVRIASIFTTLFITALIVVTLGISKNSTVHINRKPTKTEAYAMAKVFIKDKLKQPEKAVFASSATALFIDTATSIYYISSSVKIENNGGRMERSVWEVKMKYTDGDWAERNSWQPVAVTITSRP